MDSLLMQMRAKYLRDRQESRQLQGSTISSSSRGGRNFPPQRSQSFKEKKTAGRWLREQFSGQRGGQNESSDDEMLEHVTAVAAAVFAVRSVEDQSEFAAHKTNADRRHRETSSAKMKYINNEDDTRPSAPPPALDPAKSSQRLSDKDVLRDPGEGSDGKQKQKPTDQKLKDPSSSASFKKTPTFSDKKPDIISISGSKRFSKPEEPPPTPTPIPILIPRPPTPPISRKTSNSTGPTETKKTNLDSNPTPTKADLWEKAKMAKIRDKYEKVNETISYWETKKREKAMRKLEETQGVGVKRMKREKGRNKFEEDMEFIKEIAAEARAKAEEKRRSETLKAKQKADVIRETGDLPFTCYCC